MGPWCNVTRCGMRIPQLEFNSQRVPIYKYNIQIPRDVDLWQVNFTIASMAFS